MENNIKLSRIRQCIGSKQYEVNIFIKIVCEEIKK